MKLIIIVSLIISTTVMSTSTAKCVFSQDMICEFENRRESFYISSESFQCSQVVGIQPAAGITLSTTGSRYSYYTSYNDNTIYQNEVKIEVKNEATASAGYASDLSNSWSTAPSETWNRETTKIISYTVLPDFKIRIWQQVVECGSFKVRNSKIRREDIDLRHIPRDYRKETHEAIADAVRNISKIHSNLAAQQINQTHQLHLAELAIKNRENERKHESEMAQLEARHKEMELKYKMQIAEIQNKIDTKSGDGQQQNTTSDSELAKITANSASKASAIVFFILFLIFCIALFGIINFARKRLARNSNSNHIFQILFQKPSQEVNPVNTDLLL